MYRVFLQQFTRAIRCLYSYASFIVFILSKLLSKQLNHQPASHLVTRRAEHDDGGSDGERRHRQHRGYHPIRARELWVEAHRETLLVGYPLEDLEDPLGRQDDLLLLRVLVRVLPLGGQLEAVAPDLRLVAPAAAVTLPIGKALQGQPSVNL